MNKEYLEALQFIVNEALFSEFTKETNIKVRECNDIVRQALQRLESIDNANPSETMKCLDKMYDTHILKNVDCYNTIKKYILKAQEQEKVLSIIKEKNVWVARLKGLIKKYNDLDALRIYNANMPSIDYQLTQQEFNSLKELLKDDEHKYD